MGLHDVINFYSKEKYRKLKDTRREEEKLDREIERAREKLRKENARLNKKQ